MELSSLHQAWSYDRNDVSYAKKKRINGVFFSQQRLSIVTIWWSNKIAKRMIEGALLVCCR